MMPFDFPHNQIIVVPSNGTYTIAVDGTGSGTFDLVPRDWQNGQVLKATTFKDVSVTTQTKARLICRTHLLPQPTDTTRLTLEVDANSDGIFEMAIQPTILFP